MKMKSFYPQSKAIFQKIKNSEKILINVHRHPDLDSVGSALALFLILKKLGKIVRIVSPQKISEKYLFLPEARKIEKIDFSSFDFSPYDIFFILDSSSFEMVTGRKEIFLPKIKKIIIDHHRTNNLDGLIRLIDEEASAVGEIIFCLLCDWRISIDDKIATCLFASIYTDTVCLKYPRLPKRTFEIVNQLVKMGADQKDLIKNFYQKYSFADLKLLGFFLTNLKFEKKYRLVWTGIDFETFIKFKGSSEAKEILADNFLQSINKAEIGMVIVEDKKRVCRVSFRSRGRIDVSKIAQKLGGGGHKNAAGTTIYENFKKTVELIFREIKKTIKT